MKKRMVSAVEYLWVTLAVLNAAAFWAMGADKRRAKRRAWRIPEAVLFLLAIFGGSLGAVLGMQVFRHKTRHWYFALGMPAILAAHLVLGWLLLK